MKREPGYYWVIYRELKQISYWNGFFWFIFNCNERTVDKDIETIFEDKICPP